MNRYYAGIGSRETPKDILDQMTELATHLELSGWVLRSGNATGADQAFAKGVLGTSAEIWLPHAGFERQFRIDHPKHTYKIIDCGDDDAWNSIDEYHPNPSSLKLSGKQFMARNYRQVIGKDGAPNSEFILCWTKAGLTGGGTGQALRIARDRGIPVYNLADMSMEQALDHIEIWH